MGNGVVGGRRLSRSSLRDLPHGAGHNGVAFYRYGDGLFPAWRPARSDGVFNHEIGGQHQNKPEERNKGVDRVANRVVGEGPKVFVVKFKKGIRFCFFRGMEQYIEEIKHLPGILADIATDVIPGVEASKKSQVIDEHFNGRFKIGT